MKGCRKCSCWSPSNISRTTDKLIFMILLTHTHTHTFKEEHSFYAWLSHRLHMYNKYTKFELNAVQIYNNKKLKNLTSSFTLFSGTPVTLRLSQGYKTGTQVSWSKEADLVFISLSDKIPMLALCVDCLTAGQIAGKHYGWMKTQ